MENISRDQAVAIRDAAATGTLNIKKLTPIQRRALDQMLKALSKSKGEFVAIDIKGFGHQEFHELERRLTEKLPPARSSSMKKVAKGAANILGLRTSSRKLEQKLKPTGTEAKTEKERLQKTRNELQQQYRSAGKAAAQESEMLKLTPQLKALDQALEKLEKKEKGTPEYKLRQIKRLEKIRQGLQEQYLDACDGITGDKTSKEKDFLIRQMVEVSPALKAIDKALKKLGVKPPLVPPSPRARKLRATALHIPEADNHQRIRDTILAFWEQKMTGSSSLDARQFLRNELNDCLRAFLSQYEPESKPYMAITNAINSQNIDMKVNILRKYSTRENRAGMLINFSERLKHFDETKELAQQNFIEVTLSPILR